MIGRARSWERQDVWLLVLTVTLLGEQLVEMDLVSSCVGQYSMVQDQKQFF